MVGWLVVAVCDEGSYLRLMALSYHSTLGLRVWWWQGFKPNKLCARGWLVVAGDASSSNSSTPVVAPRVVGGLVGWWQLGIGAS